MNRKGAGRSADELHAMTKEQVIKYTLRVQARLERVLARNGVLAQQLKHLSTDASAGKAHNQETGHA